MALPTSYTNDTFEDYLKYEVLQETAFSLGWAADVPITPVTWTVTLISIDAGSKVVRVKPLKYPIPKGTVLEFRHRTTNALLGTAETVADAFVDYDFLALDTALGTVSPSYIYKAQTTTQDLPPAEPIFEPAIRDTLAVLGVSDITTITGLNNLAKLRARGRVEIWHKVVSFTSFDYTYQNQGATLNRHEIYENALVQYGLAIDEWNTIETVVDVVVETSEQRSVRVVW